RRRPAIDVAGTGRRDDLDHGQPRTNTYHHPEKLLAPEDDP
ncbi:hypothetical protein, partial [Mycobacterium sp. 1423905.2]